MEWTLVEKEQIAARPVGSEDGILLHPNLYAVLDGHSSGVAEPIQGLTPGQFVVKAGISALRELEASPPSPQELVRHLSERVGEALKQAGRFVECVDATRPHLVRRPGFVFTAFLPRENTIIRVGDCQYFVDGEGQNDGLAMDQYKACVRKVLLEPLLSRDGVQGLMVSDPSQPVMMRMTLDIQHPYRNLEDPRLGYGVIDGTPVPSTYIEVIKVPDVARKVILTSDGLPPHVVSGSWKETMEKHLAMLKDDPLCLSLWSAARGLMQGQTVPDDCSYVRLSRVPSLY